jgi:hypothetical protein
MEPIDKPSIEGALAAQMTVAASAKWCDFVNEIHPEWLERLKAPFDIINKNIFPSALLRDALFEQFNLRWPNLSALTHPMQAIWLLPREDILHVCQHWAVFVRRGQLIRCLDSNVRRSIRQLVGESAFENILQIPFRPEESFAAGIPLDPNALAAEGLNMLRVSYPAVDNHNWRIASMAFKPDVTQPNNIGYSANTKPKAEKNQFCELLVELFPEHAWLFG